MLSDQLTQWFLDNQRDLPWRKTQDPYAIWLSEVMLQQTTVKVVIPYFEKFLKEFPTIEVLAKAREEKVLSLWSGLGYYSRAKNLHEAAKQVTKLGSFPQNYNELLKLKGVGAYTAAAVASIAYGEVVPVVDGNVMRVVTRLFDIADDLSLKETQLKIKNHCQKLITDQNPRIFNQAMMELGATVCVPRNPTCLICPVSQSCLAMKNTNINERPVKGKKVKQEPWQWIMKVVVKDNRIALVKNSNGTPWLKNSWVLPGEAYPLLKKPKMGWDLKHSITKHNIFVQIRSGSVKEYENLKWVKSGDIKKLGVSSIVLKILELEKFQVLAKGEF